MTEDKTKVKDLATELGVPTKNLLQALRELDIPAKSTSSNIAAEDIDRVKNHLKDSATSEQGDRREVQPGVIVRRRRQSTEDVAAEGEEAPRAERRAPRENHTPTARIVSVPGASEAQDAAPVPSAEPEAPAAPGSFRAGTGEGRRRGKARSGCRSRQGRRPEAAPAARQPAEKALRAA